MAKRPVTIDSDDEDYASTSKRAKSSKNTIDVDDDEPVTSRGTQRKGKSKKKSDEDQDEDAEVEEDDEGFEEKHGEKIRESVKAKQQIKGGVAEHGIIEKVYMENFMCHRNLQFDFGPQINFIIGHNGSGKSAVLSAITIALGGKSSSTGRGNGLKAFVREGDSQATVELTLKNQGEEAYKPDVYGKSILIIRKFTKDGSASWKICAADRTVVSTQRQELSAICDHMNIQVDNPMSVLTQDAARQFLSASDSHQKYMLFLRGTQLQQLSDEYDACHNNIRQTSKVLQQKSELVPELQEKYDDVKGRFAEAKKAREQHKKVETLKKELAWAHVAVKKREFEQRVADVTKKEARIANIEEKVEAEDVKLVAANAEVERFEAEVDGLGTIDNLNDEKQRLSTISREKKAEMAALKTDIRSINTEKKATDETIKRFEELIESEHRRMAAANSEQRQEVTRRLEAAKAAFIETEERAKRLSLEGDEKHESARGVEGEGRAHEQELRAAQERIQNFHGLISQCQNQQRDTYAAYGRDIRGVQAKLKSLRWHGNIPLGPLGLDVKLKKQEYASVIRSQLAHSLLSFAITDNRDRSQLKQVLDQFGNQGTSIVIYEPDLFDYSEGEPPEEYLTVLRALEFSNEYVKRILINQNGIERLVLGRTRKEVDQQLRVMEGGSGWSADMMRVVVYHGGGGSSTGLTELSTRHPASGLFRGSNMADQIIQYQQQLGEAEEAHKAVQRTVADLRTSYRVARQEAEKLKRQAQQAWDEHRKAKLERDQLIEQINNDLPADLAAYQREMQEAEDSKRSFMTQFEALQQKLADLAEELKPIIDQTTLVNSRISDFQELKNAAVKKVEGALTKRVKAQQDKDFYAKKLPAEKEQLGDLKEALGVTEQELTTWTGSAQDFAPEEVPNPRAVEVIKRQIDNTETALKNREKQQGQTVEELTMELNKRQTELESVQRDLHAMQELNKQLRSSLFTRVTRWHDFRRHIALRCKIIFGYNLSHRGYYGKVLFKHESQELEIKVQTDDMVGTQTRDKDPRSLSGGEKSFSTICLLLSLWESIGCPLRCLDEFDVFMDAVNRRISMRMMIDSASSSDKKQYILITPQDMAGITFGSQVEVHRMKDPVRGGVGGQTTLPFTAA